MKKIMSLLFYTVLFFAAHVQAQKTVTPNLMLTYIDSVINSDGSVTKTQFNKYPAGESKKVGYILVGCALVGGTIASIAAYTSSETTESIAVPIFSVFTAISALGACASFIESGGTPGYKPSCFETDQKEGPYEYIVRNQTREYNPTIPQKNPQAA